MSEIQRARERYEALFADARSRCRVMIQGVPVDGRTVLVEDDGVGEAELVLEVAALLLVHTLENLGEEHDPDELDRYVRRDLEANGPIGREAYLWFAQPQEPRSFWEKMGWVKRKTPTGPTPEWAWVSAEEVGLSPDKELLTILGSCRRIEAAKT